MSVQHVGGGAFILDTEDIDEMQSRDEAYRAEQNMDQQADEMVRSWDHSQLTNDANEHVPGLVRERGTFESDYYEGDQCFDELKADMTEEVKGTLWIKKEVSNPEGEEVHASSTIQFDRIGYIEFNPIPIESTIHDGRPTILNLKDDSLMPGIIQGLLFLREGESAYLLISPALLYGALGAPPTIPPHAYMLYYVRVHKVWAESDMEAISQNARDQRWEVPLKDKIELSTQHKNVANQYLADDKPKEALIRYKAALKWIEETPEEELRQSSECRKLLEILYQNTAITLNKLEMHKSASKAARKALSYNNENVKAIYQFAKARMELGDHLRALQLLNDAKKFAPDNANLQKLRTQLNLQLRDEKAKRDEILVKMSKACVY